MHAYLIVSRNESNNLAKAQEINDKTNGTLVEFPLQKISDVRELEKFTRFVQSKPQTILFTNIDNATSETFNALLKPLEEPQKNITYVMTARNEHAILPTILSRTHTIRLAPNDDTFESKTNKFWEMDTGQRLVHIAKIKERADALSLVGDLIVAIQKKLTENPKGLAPMLETANQIYFALKANGNIQLQLTNLVIALDTK